MALHNPDNVIDRFSSEALLAEQQAQYERQLDQAKRAYNVEQAIPLANKSLVNPDGTPVDINHTLLSIVDQLSNDPNSVSAVYVEQMLRSNPFIIELYNSRLENVPSFSQLAQEINQRAIAKSQHRDVYNPLYDTKSPVDDVKAANRDENISPWKKILLNTLKNLNLYNPTRDVEAEIRKEDEAISAIPKASQHSIRKLQTLRYAYLELENLRYAAQQATSLQERRSIQEKMLAQQYKIQSLEDMITPQDEANIEQFGEQYFNHVRRREDLKGVEEALTPRYQSTVDRERMNAELKKEYLARGESASFTDPKSFTNGYALSWVYNNLNWETMTNEVAPEVLPWVAIAMAKDAALFAATGGVGTPFILANIAADLGLAANSAMAAIDKNVDAYFEQHGTTAGFSELKSHVMEGIAYLLDMYGSKLIAGGLPAAADKFLQGIRSKVMHTAQEVYEKGAEISAKMGSLEPVKAALKQIYNTVTLSSITQELGKVLVEAGEKSAMRYGGSAGIGAKGLGKLIQGTEKLWTSGIKNPALGLATENVMSETARQVGRQNGMNPEAIAESGMEGLLAGPIGRVGGVIGGGAKHIAKKYIQEPLEDRGNRFANTNLEMRQFREGVRDILKGGSLASKVEAINKLTNHINKLEERLGGTAKSDQLEKLRKKIINKYMKFLPMGEEGADSLLDVEDVRNLLGEQANVKETKSKLKEYEKDLAKYKRWETDAESADEIISKQVDEIKGLRSQLSTDISKDSAAFYNLNATAQKAYLTEELGYSDKVAESIIEDSNKKLSVKGVSDTAMDRIRNVFGFTAPGVVKQAIETATQVDQDLGKTLAAKLDDPLAKYTDLTAEIDTSLKNIDTVAKGRPLTNEEKEIKYKLAEAKSNLESVFKNPADKIRVYQDTLTDKEIKGDTVTLDELTKISPDFAKADPAEQMEVLDIIHSNPELADTSNFINPISSADEVVRAALEGLAEEEGITDVEGTGKLTRQVLDAIHQHNKQFITDKNSRGSKKGTSEPMANEAGVVDKDTNTRFSWKNTATGSPYTFMQNFLTSHANISEIEETAKDLESEKFTDYLNKMNKAFRDRRAVKNAIKRLNAGKADSEKVKLEDVKITDLGKLIEQGINRDTILNELKAAVNYLAKFEGVKEKHAEEAAAKSDTEYGGSKRLRRKSGHKSETEKRNEAEEAKRNSKASKELEQASSYLEQFSKDIKDAGAEFLMEWSQTDLIKFIAYIHDSVFSRFSPFSAESPTEELIQRIERVDGARAFVDTNDLLRAIVNALSDGDKTVNALFEFEGTKPVLSQKILGQLSVLSNVCHIRAEIKKEADLESYAKLFGQLHDLLALAINQGLIVKNTESKRSLWKDVTATAYKEVFADNESRRNLWDKYLNPAAFDTLVAAVDKWMQQFQISSTLADINNTAVFEIARMLKANSVSFWNAMPQLKGTKLANLMEDLVDEDQQSLVSNLFNIVNHISSNDKLWTWLSEAWGWRDETHGVTTARTLREELVSNSDKQVRDFFTIDSSDPSVTRTPDDWKQRFNALAPDVKQRIAITLFNNKYILAKLVKLPLKQDVSNDQGKDNAVTRAKQLSGFNFEVASSVEAIDKCLTDLYDNAKIDLDTSVKVFIVNQLFALGLAAPGAAAQFQLNALMDATQQNSVPSILLTSVQAEAHPLGLQWYNLQQLVTILLRNKNFKEFVDYAAKHPLGVTGVLPSGKTIESWFTGSSDLAELKRFVGTIGTPTDADVYKFIQNNFGNLVAGTILLQNATDASGNSIDLSDPNAMYAHASATASTPKQLEVHLSLDTKDNGSNILTTLSNAFSYANAGTNTYNSVQTEREDVNANDFARLTQAILDSTARLSDDDIHNIQEDITSSGEWQAQDQNAIQQYLTALQNKQPYLADTISDSSKSAIAQALARFINSYNIGTEKIFTAYKTESDKAVTPVVTKDTEATELKPYKIHQNAPVNIHAEDRASQIFITPKRSVFFVRNGLNQFLRQNPGFANNSFINLINKCVDKLRHNVVKFDDFIGDCEFDLNGNIYKHTLQVAATVGLSMLPRLSVDTNPDYIQTLAVAYGTRIADVFADPNNNLVDLSTTAYSMGSIIARTLGYNPHSLAFDIAARRLGTLAILSLVEADIGVSVKWITKAGEKLDDSSTGEMKAGAIPALEISQKAVRYKDEIKQATEFKENGDRADLAEKLLGTEMYANEKAYTSPEHLHDLNNVYQEYKDIYFGTIKAFKDWRATSKNNGKKLAYEKQKDSDKNKTFSYDIFKEDFQQAHKEAIYSELKPGKQVGQYYRIGDYAVVIYAVDAEGRITEWSETNATGYKHMVFHHRSVIKSDLTAVVPYRLLTTALNMEQGVEADPKDLFKLFSCLLKDERGTHVPAYTYEQACHMRPDELDALCRKQRMDKGQPVLDEDGEPIYDLTALGVLLYTGRRYGSNPNERGGHNKLNKQRANIEDFKRLVRDVEILYEKKVFEPSTGKLKFYFNELNTANNRLYVDSLIFNYREFKQYRYVTNINNSKNVVFDTKQFDEKAATMLLIPLFASLGFDVDKMESLEQIQKLYTDLVTGGEFKKLIQAVSNAPRNPADAYDTVIAAIANYKAEATYDTFKGSKQTVEAKVKTNIESITALLNLFEARNTGGKTLASAILASSDFKTFLDNVVALGTLSGLQMYTEYDGLTNGPSFKNIISNLVANTDAFSKLYLGATGISGEFDNIITGYDQFNVRDTYLFNGDISKRHLVYNAVEAFQNNHMEMADTFAYMNSLYGKPAKVGTDEKYTVPNDFLDTFLSALDNILNRDFMKPIVMVIGYEAGKASVIFTTMLNLDEKFDRMCAKGKVSDFENWVDSTRRTIGNGTIKLQYLDNNKIEEATLNLSDGTIRCHAFGVMKLSELTSDQLRRFSIKHADNAVLYNAVSDVFSQMYDAIAKNKEIVQTPFKVLTESSQVLCNVLNTFLGKALQAAADKSDDMGSYILSSEFMPKLIQVSNQVRKAFNTVMRTGLETQAANKAYVDLTKEEMDSIIGQAIGAYTTTKDGKVYVRVKTGVGAKESRGAGVVPISIHTLDSSVMHLVMAKIQSIVGRRILTIHDAMLVQPILELVNGNTGGVVGPASIQGSDAVRLANKEHYGSQVGMVEAFADYLQNMFKALNSISALRTDPNHFGIALSQDEALSLINQVQANTDDLYSEVIQLITLKEQFFAKQSALDEQDRVKDGQYAGTAGMGTYTPDDADLKALNDRLETVKLNLNQSAPIHRYRDVLTSAIISWINTQAASYSVDIDAAKGAILNSQKNLRDKIWGKATSIDSLVAAVVSEIQKGFKDPTNDTAQATTNLASVCRNRIEACENVSIKERVEAAAIESFKPKTINNKPDKSGSGTHVSLQENVIPFTREIVTNPQAELSDQITSMVNSIISISDQIKDMFFHINREAALQRARIDSFTRLGSNRTGLLGVLNNLRNMTGLNKLSSESFSNYLAIADSIISTFKINKLDIEKVDDIPQDGKNTVLFVADSDNYTKVMNQARKSQLKQTLGTEKDITRNLAYYCRKLMANFETYRNQEVHLVFTLRSEGDILNLLALQALKTSAATANEYAKVHIHIAPAISNLTSNSPLVNKEVAIAQVLRSKYSQLGIQYVTSMTPSHNIDLQSFAMRTRLNMATATQGIQTKKQTILGLKEMTVKYGTDTSTMYSGYKEIDLTDKNNQFSTVLIVRRDDTGRMLSLPIPFNDRTQTYDLLSAMSYEPQPTDLYTSPVEGELTFAYDEHVYLNDYVYNTDKDPHKIQRFPIQGNLGDAVSEFEQVLGMDSSTAVIVETTADTDIRILANGLEEYAKEFPIFQEAIAKANKVKQQREWEYQNSRGQDIEFWRRRNRPIVVSVPSDNFTDKYFIFVTAIDNSIEASEFNASIQNQFTDPATMGQSQVKASTKLYDMLSQGARDNHKFMKMLDARKEQAIRERPNARVIIDERYVEPNLKYDTSPLSEDLVTRNGYMLSVIAEELHARGVNRYTLPVQYTNRYMQLQQGEGQVTPYIGENMTTTEIQTTMYNMGTLPKGRMHYLASSIQTMKRYEKMELATNEAIKVGNVRAYRGRTQGNLDESDVTRIASGEFLASEDVSSVGVIFGKSGQEVFNNLLDHFIAMDEEDGVDTSLVKESRQLLSGLITITGVNVFESAAGVEASKSFVSRPESPLERNTVLLGMPRGGQSISEAFLHEMFHTIWVHIGVTNPALKKKLTDMYNFVHRNLTYEDFKDGQTYTTESIMDAVFHEETPDNVEEFLCYYMTNRAFRDAVDHMANRKGKNIQEVLKANTKGFFRKLLDTVRNFFAKQDVSDSAARSVYDLCRRATEAAVIYNNKYWQQKIDLIENATNSNLIELASSEQENFAETQTLIRDKVLEKINKNHWLDDFIHKDLNEFVDSLHQNDTMDGALARVGNAWRHAQDGFLNDLMASLEGASKRQFDYLILRTRGKAQIDQKREQIKSVINEHVREILSSVPEEYYERLTMDFVRTDASCLFRNTDLTAEQIKEIIIEKRARDKQIAKLEQRLQHRSDYWYLINSAKGLAQYLVTGFNPTGIGFRNVKEIMANSGALGQGIATLNGVEDSPAQVLDQLVTLYAYNLKNNDIDYLRHIDAKTLNDLAIVHNGIKDADNDDIYPNTIRGSLHVPKGELHTVRNKHRYEIIPEAELRAYEWTGYRRVSEAELDPFFKSQFPNTRFVMVRAPYKSDATTTAGIYSMTNAFKGRSNKGISIGSAFRTNQDEVSFNKTGEYKRLRDYVTARIIALNKPNPQLIAKPTSGNLVLNFNCLDRLCGATFEVNPIESIKQRCSSQKITSIFGNLYGSILERAESPKFNEQVGQALIDIYESSFDKHLFRWIAPNSLNADYRELYDRLPPEIKEVCKEKYGDRGVPVHNKSLNTVFGYRNMSANDTRTFIENERAKHANADKLASGFSVGIHNILYNGYLGNVEYFLKYLAHVGKDNIVIKGVTTSWYNILSNCTLLHLKGLSPKQVIEYQLEGLRQFDTIKQMNYQLAVLKRKQIFGQYTDADARDEAAIRKSRESLAVYDLYKEGIVMNTIAEDLTESENFTKDIVKRLTPRGPIRTVVSNLALTNDSFLYRVLADFASLGDVAGKYALYKFNKERFKDTKEALRDSLDTFIDYSNPLPKQLQLVDDLAVLPFMKYGLGIQNALVNIMCNKTSRSLAWILGTNTILDWPSPFESLLTFDSISDRLQLPLEMYTDSWNVLPASRILTNLVPDD